MADRLDATTHVTPDRTLVEETDEADAGGGDEDAQERIARTERDRAKLTDETADGVGPGAGETGSSSIEHRAVPAEEAPSHPSLRDDSDS